MIFLSYLRSLLAGILWRKATSLLFFYSCSFSITVWYQYSWSLFYPVRYNPSLTFFWISNSLSLTSGGLQVSPHPHHFLAFWPRYYSRLILYSVSDLELAISPKDPVLSSGELDTRDQDWVSGAYSSPAGYPEEEQPVWGAELYLL